MLVYLFREPTETVIPPAPPPCPESPKPLAAASSSGSSQSLKAVDLASMLSNRKQLKKVEITKPAPKTEEPTLEESVVKSSGPSSSKDAAITSIAITSIMQGLRPVSKRPVLPSSSDSKIFDPKKILKSTPKNSTALPSSGSTIPLPTGTLNPTPKKLEPPRSYPGPNNANSRLRQRESHLQDKSQVPNLLPNKIKENEDKRISSNHANETEKSSLPKEEKQEQSFEQKKLEDKKEESPKLPRHTGLDPHLRQGTTSSPNVNPVSVYPSEPATAIKVSNVAEHMFAEKGKESQDKGLSVENETSLKPKVVSTASRKKKRKSRNVKYYSKLTEQKGIMQFASLPLIGLIFQNVFSAFCNVYSPFRNIKFDLMIWRPLRASRVTLDCSSVLGCLEKNLDQTIQRSSLLLQAAGWIFTSASINTLFQHLPIISNLSTIKRRILSDALGGMILFYGLQHYYTSSLNTDLFDSQCAAFNMNEIAKEITKVVLGTYVFEGFLSHVVYPALKTVTAPFRQTSPILNERQEKKREISFDFLLLEALQRNSKQIPTILKEMQKSKVAPSEFVLNDAIKKFPEHVPTIISAMQKGNVVPSYDSLMTALEKCPKYVPNIIDAMQKRSVAPTSYILTQALEMNSEYILNIVNAMQNGKVAPSDISLVTALEKCPKYVPNIIDAMQKTNAAPSDFVLNDALKKFPQCVPAIIDAMQKRKVAPSDNSLMTALEKCQEYLPHIIDAKQKNEELIPQYLVNMVREKCPQHLSIIKKS